MKTDGTGTRRQQGMVLMSSLGILSVLMVVGIGVGVMLQNDYRVLTNLRGATEAFYFSVAGMEWSKAEIARVTEFPPRLTDQAKKFASGDFAVMFLSSTQDGPLAVKIVVRSIGTNRVSRHLLQARLTKSYDLSDAALGLRGNGSRVNLSGDSIFISGADHDAVNGKPMPGAKPRSSVSTADDGLRALVEQAIAEPPRPGVLDSSGGMQPVTTSDHLPAAFVSQLGSQLCTSAAAILHTIPSGSSLTIENQSWGTRSAPQLHCVDGSGAPGDAVNLPGVTGVGIVVVKDADLVLSGSFHWEGLIIVTGSDVSFRVTGSATKDLIGAIVVNEAGIPGADRKILDIEGDVRVLFSRQALSQASRLIPVEALSAAYGALPTVISQDYWRTDTL